jgi:hypothetical protein
MRARRIGKTIRIFSERSAARSCSEAHNGVRRVARANPLLPGRGLIKGGSLLIKGRKRSHYELTDRRAGPRNYASCSPSHRPQCVEYSPLLSGPSAPPTSVEPNGRPAVHPDPGISSSIDLLEPGSRGRSMCGRPVSNGPVGCGPEGATVLDHPANPAAPTVALGQSSPCRRRLGLGFGRTGRCVRKCESSSTEKLLKRRLDRTVPARALLFLRVNGARDAVARVSPPPRRMKSEDRFRRDRGADDQSASGWTGWAQLEAERSDNASAPFGQSRRKASISRRPLKKIPRARVAPVQDMIRPHLAMNWANRSGLMTDVR